MQISNPDVHFLPVTEEEVKRNEEELKNREEEEKRRKVLAAWTAHKAEDTVGSLSCMCWIHILKYRYQMVGGGGVSGRCSGAWCWQHGTHTRRKTRSV